MPTDCSGSRVELLGIEVMGMALRIVLELPSDVNFMIRKWLAARRDPDIQIQIMPHG